MRISTEQLRQASQAVGSRQQKNGNDGQGTEFQGVIAQILAMMNAPLSGQSQQIQEALALAAGSINQDTTLMQGSGAYRFLAQQANLQFLYHALMGANGSETMLQAAITGLALELAKQSDAGISNELLGEAAFLQKNLSQAMNSRYFTADVLSFDALENGTTSESAMEAILEARSAALLELTEQAADLKQEGIGQSMELIQNRQHQANPVQQGMPYTGSRFSDTTENAIDELDTGQIRIEQLQNRQFNSEQIQGKQLTNDAGDSTSYNEDSVLDTNEPEVGRRVDASAYHTQALPFVRSLEAAEASQQPVQLQNLQDIANQVTEEITLLKDGDQTSLKVKLKPEELGEMEIILSMRGGQLSGEILVESITAREAIEGQLQSLKERLRSQNIMLNEINIGMQQFSQEESRGKRSSYQNGTLARQFSGQADRHDESSGRQTYSQSLRNTYRFGSIGRTFDMLA